MCVTSVLTNHTVAEGTEVPLGYYMGCWDGIGVHTVVPSPVLSQALLIM